MDNWTTVDRKAAKKKTSLTDKQPGDAAGEPAVAGGTTSSDGWQQQGSASRDRRRKESVGTGRPESAGGGRGGGSGSRGTDRGLGRGGGRGGGGGTLPRGGGRGGSHREMGGGPGGAFRTTPQPLSGGGQPSKTQQKPQTPSGPSWASISAGRKAV